ncbi:6-bladed beta-propeller [Pedobacter sp. GR22-6]|uniref:6-bladed beta-propeller n=1 Tax=Pedobacter sp. GR22-6 TaxID=3127957 RepID=UPI00307EA534
MIKPIMLFWAALLSTTMLHAQKIIPVDSSKIDTLRIDPSHAIGGNASDVFEELNYIPLESTRESTFGRIDQLEVTDDYFVIRDETTNCILFFKKNGKFHAKIDGGSYQLNDGKRLQAFHLNKWTRQLVVKRNGPGGYLYYDFNAKLLSEVPIKGKGLYYWNDYRFVGKDAILDIEDYSNDQPKDSTKINYLVQYGKGLMEQVSAEGIPYNTVGLKTNSDIYSANTAGLLPHAGKDDTFLLVTAPDYLMYEVSPQVVKLRYRFIFQCSRACQPIISMVRSLPTVILSMCRSTKS